jgi:hypothetical protein
MNKEWKLLCVDAINICGRKNTDCLKCEVRCTEIIKAAQKKLLDYLIAKYESDEDDYLDIPIESAIEMLKQLEAK